MNKREICFVLLLGILAGLMLTGCNTSQDSSAAVTEASIEAIMEATTEATTEAITEATIEATTEATTVTQNTQSSEAIQDSPLWDVFTAGSGYTRIRFDNAAFQNYEIWEHTQDGSLYFVSLNAAEMLPITSGSLVSNDSGEAIPAYSVELVHEYVPQLEDQYLPHYKLSFVDSGENYSAVDFGGKVAGLLGFCFNFGITPFDSTLDEETEWYLFPLGSMLSEDFLGYRSVSVEYSELLDGDTPNTADLFFFSELCDDVAGFAVMPTDPGSFSIRYDSMELLFDSLEHLAEYLVPQWESFEIT